VLPFENVTQRPEDAPLIDGLGDELISQFGAVEPASLGVIGRTSVMRYRDRKADLRQIGRELGIDYVIEGDVRSAGSRVRISARLIRIAGERMTWSETYERDESLRFELQEEIAARVTGAVLGLLLPASSDRRAASHVAGRGAVEAYDNGRYLLHKNSRAETERGIGWFEEAARRDPAYAEPWTALAQTYAGLALSGASGAPNFEKARAAAQQALRIDEGAAGAHTALGDVLFWNDWNWKEAQAHFKRAIALNPSFAQAWHDQAFFLVATGHPEAAVSSLRHAIAIDPLSPRVNVDAGWVLLQAHHFGEAIAQARRALELEPGFAQAIACIARAELYRGNAVAQEAQFYRSILERPEGASSYNRALAFAIFGRNEEALAALHAALAQHETMMAMTPSEPAFAKLHGDPRFQEIVRKLGL
jgi:TolB-like protein/Tfp pilus assembly protein PilF